MTPPARWTLRARLVATTVALIALVGLAIGAASVTYLDRYLTRQLDRSLSAASDRSENTFNRHPDDGFGPDGSGGSVDDRSVADQLGFLLGPGQAEGTLGGKVKGGTVLVAGYVGRDGRPQQLTGTAAASLTTVDPAGSSPVTVDVAGMGAYRAVAWKAPDGDVLVTALPLAPVHDAVMTLALVVALMTLAGLLAAGVAGAAVVQVSLRPLRRMAATATRVTTMRLDAGQVRLPERLEGADVDPRTEVGVMGVALNRMLDHVGAALASREANQVRMRRFAADASHELRTPLASIRGYAELVRRTNDDLPPDVSRAVERVESEARRMGSLVDDLLLLARLDEGGDPARAPVDLRSLVVDAVGDAQAAGPDHEWEVDLGGDDEDGDEDAFVVQGDQARLHQVVVNLLANARAHTPAGTTVTTRVRRAEGGDRVLVEVEDDGPGIAADLLPEIFERFTRGQTSRTRAAGSTSTGLGLSIVRSLVQAHAGAVSVDSRPGRTVFSVSLPAAARAARRAVPAAR